MYLNDITNKNLKEQKIINGDYNWSVFDDSNNRALGHCFQMRIKFKDTGIWRNITFFAIRPFMVSMLEEFKKVFDNIKRESKGTPIPLLSNEIIRMSSGNIYQNINSILCSSLSYCLSSLTMKIILSEIREQETNTLQILQGLHRIKG